MKRSDWFSPDEETEDAEEYTSPIDDYTKYRSYAVQVGPSRSDLLTSLQTRDGCGRLVDD